MIEADRLISGDKASAQEEGEERALRPKHLAEYVGQAKIREQLGIFISAARAEWERTDQLKVELLSIGLEFRFQ